MSLQCAAYANPNIKLWCPAIGNLVLPANLEVTGSITTPNMEVGPDPLNPQFSAFSTGNIVTLGQIAGSNVNVGNTVALSNVSVANTLTVGSAANVGGSILGRNPAFTGARLPLGAVAGLQVFPQNPLNPTNNIILTRAMLGGVIPIFAPVSNLAPLFMNFVPDETWPGGGTFWVSNTANDPSSSFTVQWNGVNATGNALIPNLPATGPFVTNLRLVQSSLDNTTAVVY
jgi:hypothetical protein